MNIRKIHHVAYRCKDAKQTVEWYQTHLGMKFVLAIAEDQVPSTHEPDPYMHIFMDAGGGNVLAFFELPGSPSMGRDEATPAWVQHIIFKSIYFHDPSGHRLELAANTGTPDMYRQLDDVKWEMLDEWSRTRRAPKHAAWMHEKEFA
jgi:catechol 2,3-dioxygenase-like lactoylglutathione lyase family enzyme